MMGAGPAAAASVAWGTNLVELGGSLHLGLLGQILNLGLTEHNVGVGGGVLVDIGLLDDKQNVLGFPDCDTGHPGDLLQAKLGHDFPGFFLSPALLVLTDSLLSGDSSSPRGLASSTLSSGILQLRNGIITIRVSTRVILLLPGLDVSDFSQFWHLAR